MEATTYLIQPTEVERPIGGDQPVVTDDRPDLCVLLDEFGDPTRLPPRRSHDHKIPILPNSSPANELILPKPTILKCRSMKLREWYERC